MVDIDNLSEEDINAALLDEQPSESPTGGGQQVNIDNISEADIDSVLSEGSMDMDAIEEEAEPKRPTINEPADISMGHRAFVKNFGPHNPEGVAKFLKEKYPDKEFAYNEDLREVTEIDPQTGEERPLDPDFSYLTEKMTVDPGRMRFEVIDGKLKSVGPKSDIRLMTKELISDAADIASDAGQAVISTGAALVGGMAGSVAGPKGALALGATMSGMADAGVETIRQIIGEKGGIPNNISEKNIALAGGMGVASTLLFGTKVGISAFHKSMLKEGSEETQKALAEKTIAQSTAMDGIIGGTFTMGKKLAQVASEKTTGISKDLYKRYVEPKTREILKSLDDAGVKQIAGEIGETVYDYWDKKIKAFGQKLTDLRQTANVEVDIAPVQKIYKNQIKHLKQSAKTPDDFRTIESMVEEYDNLFLNKKNLDVANAKRTEILNSQKKVVDSIKEKASKAKQEFAEIDQHLRNRKKDLEIMRKEYKMKGDSNPDVMRHMDDLELQIKLDEREIGERKIMSLRENKIPVMKEPSEPQKEYITSVSGEEFTNLLQNIKESGRVWKDIEGKSKAADTAMRTALDGKKALNKELDRVLVSYPDMRAEYRRLKNTETFVENFYKTGANKEKVFDVTTYDFLTSKTKHPVVTEQLMSFDKEFGSALIEKSELLRTHKYLGKHPSRAGTVQTSIVKYAGIPTVGALIGGAYSPTGGRYDYIAGAVTATALALVGLNPTAWKVYYGAGKGMKPWIEGTYKGLERKMAMDFMKNQIKFEHRPQKPQLASPELPAAGMPELPAAGLPELPQ